VSKEGEVPVLGEFAVESSQVVKRRVDLAPYFGLTRPGRYQIIATVHVKEWNQDISAPPKGFDVIRGNRIWSQEFGVPLARGSTNAAPEVRRYTLVQANYVKGQPRLYLSLTDASETKVFKVFPIGALVSFSNPEPQLDSESNLHVLFQNSGHTFTYTVISADAAVLVRQTYEYVKTRPRLTAEDKGRFAVEGGARRPMADDFPPPPPATGDTDRVPQSPH